MVVVGSSKLGSLLLGFKTYEVATLTCAKFISRVDDESVMADDDDDDETLDGLLDDSDDETVLTFDSGVGLPDRQASEDL